MCVCVGVCVCVRVCVRVCVCVCVNCSSRSAEFEIGLDQKHQSHNAACLENNMEYTVHCVGKV